MYIIKNKQIRGHLLVGSLLIICGGIIIVWQYTDTSTGDDKRAYQQQISTHTIPSRPQKAEEIAELTPQKRQIIRPIRISDTTYDNIVAVQPSALLSTKPPARLSATGNTNINYRLQLLPAAERTYTRYMVIPSLGIVTPIIVPQSSRRSTTQEIFATLDTAFLR
jgi:hypothetical protein